MVQLDPNSNLEGGEPPAKKVIRLLGEQTCMDLCGLTSEALRKWKRSKTSGGGGGLVPAYYQARVLRAAVDQGLALSAEDLIADPI